MVPFHNLADVAILIGNNLPSAIKPRGVIAGNDDEPYAQKLILGWKIVGVVGSSQEGNVLVSNWISVSSRSSLPVTMATSKALIKPQECSGPDGRCFLAAWAVNKSVHWC